MTQKVVASDSTTGGSDQRPLAPASPISLPAPDLMGTSLGPGINSGRRRILLTGIAWVWAIVVLTVSGYLLATQGRPTLQAGVRHLLTEAPAAERARVGLTATSLANGRVLIAGGSSGPYDVFNQPPALDSAELFNPPDGRFSLTGSMIAPRYEHSATLLRDGRVLIVGGDETGIAELYDPKSGTFTLAGHPGGDRWVATLLKDGRVLLTSDATVTAPGQAQIFDPATGRFTTTGSMTRARLNYSATLLADGRVLIAGGLDSNWAHTSSAELYDPSSGTFTETGPMRHARSDHAAALLPDGRVLVAGDEPATTQAEVYDPSTGSFDLTGSMVEPRGFPVATPLPDGRVLLTGGTDQRDRPQASAEIYDPRTSRFSATGSMSFNRLWHAAALLNDGRVLVVGGAGSDQRASTIPEVWDPTTGEFRELHWPPKGSQATGTRDAHAGGLIATGR